MAEIVIDVDVNLSEDAKRIMRHRELLERQRLAVLADIYRFTVVQLLCFDDSEQEEKE